ncbi:uncharacterized protein TNCV_4152711 [Trichonephila clavipes]|nr:uncharacterized protein TNCV_4152711 [Trichonephila clavipes]
MALEYPLDRRSTLSFGRIDTPLDDLLQYVEDSKDFKLVEKKRVTDTRLCARADATMNLFKGYNSFQKALQVIAEIMTQKLQVIHEAKCIMEGFEAILIRTNGVNKPLQMKPIELQTAVNLLKSLLEFLNSRREMFYEYERKAF